MPQTNDIAEISPKSENPRIYQFADFQIDTVEETLYQSGEKRRINRRTFQVLRLLVERAGEIVSKQEFSETVWADTFVEDNSLTVTMTALRKILGDDPKQPKFIENLPRKGYRFISEVKVAGDATPAAEIERNGETAFSETETSRKTIQNRKALKDRKILFVIGAACLLFLVVAFSVNYSGFANVAVPPPNTNQIESAQNTNQIESVAVLPFENQNPETEYLSDGLTENLINNLSRLSNLRVISRSSVFQYKGKSADLAAIGRELNVRAVLTGRFIQDGDNLTVSAELTDTRNNQQIWSRRYQRQTSDQFGLQQEILREISEILRQQLTGEQQRQIAKRATDSPEAFQLYLKGRYFWNKRTAEGFAKAVDFFNQALEKDPTYALAYVGLANCYLSGTFEFIDTQPKRVAMVEAALQKALEIDDTLGEAYAVLGINKCYYEWDFAGAEREYKRAIELNPNYATAHHWYADLLAMEGRFDESFAEYRRALELDPLSLAINTDLGLTYYYARQPELAINHLNKLKEIDAGYARTYLYLVQIYRAENMFEESIATTNKYSTLSGDNLGMGVDVQTSIKRNEMLGDAFKTSGAKGYWKKMLEFALENKSSETTHMAKIYAKLDERDKAFELLEKAYTVRSTVLLWLKVSPEFDSLRADPRFSDLVRRVGLPQQEQ